MPKKRTKLSREATDALFEKIEQEAQSAPLLEVLKKYGKYPSWYYKTRKRHSGVVVKSTTVAPRASSPYRKKNVSRASTPTFVVVGSPEQIADVLRLYGGGK